MTNEKQRFSDFLIKKYRIIVKEMNEFDVPQILFEYAKIGAMGICGKYVLIKQLDMLDEQTLCAYLLHEADHCRRQRKLGWWLWAYLYASSMTFRRKEEVRTYARNMEWDFMHGHASEKVPESYATSMKNSYYLTRSQYKKARKSIFKTWNKIKGGGYCKVRKLHDDWYKTS